MEQKGDSRKLAKLVLDWWKEHEYDSAGSGPDEQNIYDEPPEMVVLAEEMCRVSSRNRRRNYHARDELEKQV